MTDQSRLPPGLYESVVTDRLSGALSSVAEELVGLDDLDPADGDVVIARHVAGVVLRLLRSVPGPRRTARPARSSGPTPSCR